MWCVWDVSIRMVSVVCVRCEQDGECGVCEV